MISVSQIKAARALLSWSALDLANISEVGVATIRRYEMQEGVPDANISVLKKIKICFEKAGVEFTGDPLKNPGVTLHLDETK
jgi:ribosome-binding protein aMBF1 (putative translation factor)